MCESFHTEPTTARSRCRLGAIAEIVVSGVDKVVRRDEQAVQLCNYMDVYNKDVIRPSASLMRATATAGEVRKYRLERGDVVITKDSEDPADIAVPAFVEESAPDLVCGYHLAIVRPGPMARGRYLKHWFELPLTRAYFKSRANGATRFGLTIGAIEGCVVALPELVEQDRVVEMLSQWDRAIELGVWRLSKARERKGSLMQTLFTGEMRFSDFEGRPWSEVRLGEMGACRLLRGRGITKKDLAAQGVPCLRYADIYSRYDQTTDLLTTYVDEEVAEVATALVRGDVICAASGETREEIGKAVAWLGAERAVVGGDTVTLRDHGQNPVFLAHALNSSDVVRQKVSRGKGDAVVHLHAGELARVTVRLPSLPEQHRIAAVLETADAEVALRRDLITQLRGQKRGLREQLLTGKLRIPSPSEFPTPPHP